MLAPCGSLFVLLLLALAQRVDGLDVNCPECGPVGRWLTTVWVLFLTAFIAASVALTVLLARGSRRVRGEANR